MPKGQWYVITLILLEILVNLVSLRYPNVRLALINRLLLYGDCIVAFAETARECGLNCPNDLSTVRREVESGACGSLTIAKLVLKETVPAVAESIWEQLVASVKAYKRKRKQKHCRGIDLEPTKIDCSGMAPIVMDLLLQLLETSQKT